LFQAFWDEELAPAGKEEQQANRQAPWPYESAQPLPLRQFA